MFAIQTPAVAPQTPTEPVLRRVFKPAQVERFRVVSDWDSPRGVARYEYEMRMETERFVGTPPVEFKQVVRLLNLKAVYDGVETRNKAFGILPFRLRVEGAPIELSMEGMIGTFAIPLLSMAIPKDPLVADKPLAIVGLDRFTGDARIEKMDARTVTLKLSLVANPTTYLGTTTFRRDTGQLLKSEGKLVQPDGTLTFTITRM